jgi:hypothetical protein
MLFFLYNMCRPFRPSSGKSFLFLHIHQTFPAMFPPTLASVYIFKEKVIYVVYNIDANYSSYANIKYMVKISFIKIRLNKTKIKID